MAGIKSEMYAGAIAKVEQDDCEPIFFSEDQLRAVAEASVKSTNTRDRYGRMEHLVASFDGGEDTIVYADKTKDVVTTQMKILAKAGKTKRCFLAQCSSTPPSPKAKASSEKGGIALEGKWCDKSGIYAPQMFVLAAVTQAPKIFTMASRWGEAVRVSAFKIRPSAAADNFFKILQTHFHDNGSEVSVTDVSYNWTSSGPLVANPHHTNVFVEQLREQCKLRLLDGIIVLGCSAPDGEAITTAFKNHKTTVACVPWDKTTQLTSNMCVDPETRVRQKPVYPRVSFQRVSGCVVA